MSAKSWHGSRPPEENHIVVAAYRERDEARAEVQRLVRANDRLETALCHIINRVSTEGRDDESKHIFLVGSEAIVWARAEREGRSE